MSVSDERESLGIPIESQSGLFLLCLVIRYGFIFLNDTLASYIGAMMMKTGNLDTFANTDLRYLSYSQSYSFPL